MVTERAVKDLPLNGRSFDNLIALNRGSDQLQRHEEPNTSTSDGNTFSVDGRRTTENLFLLNGIEYTGSSQLAVSPGGVSGELLGIDAVREFNVLTDTYGAEYGKRAGAQVSVVTQSGTQCAAWDAVRVFAKQRPGCAEFLRPGVPCRRSDGTSSEARWAGRLKKNKLFLFGNYEGFRQSLALSSVSVVPDAQARLGISAECFRSGNQGHESESGDAAVHVVLARSEWPGAGGWNREILQ